MTSIEAPVDNLNLAGYVPLVKHGFALPCFAVAESPNLWHTAICSIETDHLAQITGFHAFHSDEIHLLEKGSIRPAHRGSRWCDVFLWNDQVYVGEPSEIWAALGNDRREILQKKAPISLLDLALFVEGVDKGPLARSAYRYIEDRFDSNKAISWRSDLLFKPIIQRALRRLAQAGFVQASSEDVSLIALTATGPSELTINFPPDLALALQESGIAVLLRDPTLLNISSFLGLKCSIAEPQFSDRENRRSSAKPRPPSASDSTLENLRIAVWEHLPTVGSLRQAFLDEWFAYADSLRTRERPLAENEAERIVDVYERLISVRDQVTNWVLLEAALPFDQSFVDTLLEALERLRVLKSRPAEVTQWNDSWFEAHQLFAYETFLYVIAALLRTKSYDALRQIYEHHYLKPVTERYTNERFDTFEEFYAYSELLQKHLAPPNYTLASPAAELIKRHAKRTDITFDHLTEADLLTFCVALTSKEKKWYPQLMVYVDRYTDFPIFVNATRQKDFAALSVITGLKDGDALRGAAKVGYERLGVSQWRHFWGRDGLMSALNLEALDTLP